MLSFCQSLAVHNAWWSHSLRIPLFPNLVIYMCALIIHKPLLDITWEPVRGFPSALLVCCHDRFRNGNIPHHCCITKVLVHTTAAAGTGKLMYRFSSSGKCWLCRKNPLTYMWKDLCCVVVRRIVVIMYSPQCRCTSVWLSSLEVSNVPAISCFGNQYIDNFT